MYSSRASANELLAGLRAGRWQAPGWARFAASSARRSARQATWHPRALAEVTILHAMLALLAGRSRRWRVAASWSMAATHLGLLESRRSLGAANVITLIRANLPAIGGPSRWLPTLALASDLADGPIARRAGAVTAFLCFPCSHEAGEACVVVVLDAGHGGSHFVLDQ